MSSKEVKPEGKKQGSMKTVSVKGPRREEIVSFFEFLHGIVL